MKLPRDIDGASLARSLGDFGFEIDRIKGSHMVLKHADTQRIIVVPAHRPLKIGTLAAILKSVSEITGQSVEQIVNSL